jgi:hypothetical protein
MVVDKREMAEQWCMMVWHKEESRHGREIETVKDG